MASAKPRCAQHGVAQYADLPVELRLVFHPLAAGFGIPEGDLIRVGCLVAHAVLRN
jgi:hypothetical protein